MSSPSNNALLIAAGGQQQQSGSCSQASWLLLCRPSTAACLGWEGASPIALSHFCQQMCQQTPMEPRRSPAKGPARMEVRQGTLQGPPPLPLSRRTPTLTIWVMLCRRCSSPMQSLRQSLRADMGQLVPSAAEVVVIPTAAGLIRPHRTALQQQGQHHHPRRALRLKWPLSLASHSRSLVFHRMHIVSHGTMTSKAKTHCSQIACT